MKPKRWQQIEELYQTALERHESQRAAFLEAACGGDGELRREVESLLAHQAPAADFLEAPAMRAVAGITTDTLNRIITTLSGEHSHVRAAGPAEACRSPWKDSFCARSCLSNQVAITGGCLTVMPCHLPALEFLARVLSGTAARLSLP